MQRSTTTPTESVKPEHTEALATTAPQTLAASSGKLPPFDLNALFTLAINQGSAETVERMMAIRRELNAEAAKQAFTDALAAFQKACPIIAKNKPVNNSQDKGGGTRYYFAPLDYIITQVRDLITEHGFSYRFDSKTTGQIIEVKCIVTHNAGHSESSSFQSTTDKPPGANQQQGFASGLSYAKRYAFCLAFGIQTGDEDDDANSTVPDKSAKAELMRRRAMKEQLAQEADFTREPVIHNDPDDQPTITRVESNVTPAVEALLTMIGEANDAPSLTALAPQVSAIEDDAQKTIARNAVRSRASRLNLKWTGSEFVPKTSTAK